MTRPVRPSENNRRAMAERRCRCHKARLQTRSCHDCDTHINPLWVEICMRGRMRCKSGSLLHKRPTYAHSHTAGRLTHGSMSTRPLPVPCMAHKATTFICQRRRDPGGLCVSNCGVPNSSRCPMTLTVIESFHVGSPSIRWLLQPSTAIVSEVLPHDPLALAPELPPDAQNSDLPRDGSAPSTIMVRQSSAAPHCGRPRVLQCCKLGSIFGEHIFHGECWPTDAIRVSAP